MAGLTAAARLLGRVHGGRRPDEQLLTGLEREAHGDRRVLPLAVDVVHPRLGVAQRRLAAPAVGEHPEALVDEALVPQGLERPEHALHVVEVERLVVVLEVDPPGLRADVLLPVLRVPQHRRAAGVVELGDAERLDLRLVRDPELLLGLDLGGQAVAVPAEAALDPAAAHRLVAGHDVLDVARQQVAVVRQPVGEGRAVVEDELVAAVRARGALLDAGDERAVLVPVPQDPRLDLREAGGRRDVSGTVLRVAHRVLLAARSQLSREDDASRRPAGGHRGTTSLAAAPAGPGRRPLVRRLSRAAPVRFY